MTPLLPLPAPLHRLHQGARLALAAAAAAASRLGDARDEAAVEVLREALVARERALLALGLALTGWEACPLPAPSEGCLVEEADLPRPPAVAALDPAAALQPVAPEVPGAVVVAEADRPRLPAVEAPDPAVALEPVSPAAPGAVVVAEADRPRPPRVEDPPQPLPAGAIAALQARFQGGGAVRFASPPPPATLLPLVGRLRPPAVFPETEAEKKAERDHIAWILSQLQADRSASAAQRHAFLTALAARLRALQEQGGGPLSGLERLFGLMAGQAQQHQLDFVHGLRIDHRPALAASWPAEAEAAHHALRLLLGLGPDPVGAQARFAARLARRPQAVKEALQCAIAAGLRLDHPALAPHVPARSAASSPAEPAAAEEPTAPVDPDLRALTEGKRALIVGADARNDCRERLLAAFGFASLTWETGTKVRRVRATAERLRQGGVDIAIFLKRFISHSLTQQLLPAADKGGVTVAWVDQGYGGAAIAEALRKAMGERRREAA